MNDTPVAIAALTLAGSIAAGFFAMISRQDKTHTKLTKAIDNNTKMISKLSTKTDHNSKLVHETVVYLKHRNGTFEALIKDAPTLHALAQKINKEAE